MIRSRAVLRGLGMAVLILGFAGTARAQIGSERYSAIVIDQRSGNTLIAANADEPRFPASLTKMMTLYMLFEAMRDGRASLGTPIRMSEEAASRPPSKLGLPAGGVLTAEQAILALVTKSANDVASAIGELLGGSEDRFAQMMTLRARALGMTRTTFRNASGLPDYDQSTTARDMATLGRRLFQDFPEHWHYFGTLQFAWGRGVIRNHNRMLGDYEGADGIKTGYIRDSGFNIVTSAQRDGVRLVGAVFGGSTSWERDRHMGSLLDQGFERMGVAPRAPAPLVAAARAPLLLGAAQAASLRGGPAPAARYHGRLALRPPPPMPVARVPVARTPVARMPVRGRAGTRIEQGDTNRVVAERPRRGAPASAQPPRTRVATNTQRRG